jgi:hypothetical protein
MEPDRARFRQVPELLLAGASFAVVTLAALLAEVSTSEACLGPVARELTGRFTACGGRAE